MNTRKKILVTTDLSELAAGALDYAIDFARSRGAEMHLVFSEELNPYAPDPAFAHLPQFEWMVRERVEHNRQLQALSEQLEAAHGLPVFTHYLEGAAEEQILAAIGLVCPEYVVMSTHGRSGFNRAMFGSVTEQILRNSPVPVICVKSAMKPAALGPDVILTTDGSSNSLSAKKFAIELVRQSGGQLHLVLVLQRGFTNIWTAALKFDDFDQMFYRHQQLAAELTHDEALPVVPHVLRGDAAECIVSCASQTHARAIVMATHGRTGVQRLLLGSVTEQVVRNSVCPVLVVGMRTPQSAFTAGETLAEAV